MRILLLGGNGFIGSHLIDGFLSAGYDVRVFNHSSEKFRLPNPKVEYVEGLFGDYSKLDSALADVDIVYHLIWSSVPSTSNAKIISGLNENVINTVKLIELMEKNGVKKIVFFSSGGAVYGNINKNVIGEDTLLFPISAYGISKMTIEKYIHLFQHQSKIEGIVLRPSNPYGSRQNFNGVQGVISRFLYLIFKGEPLTVLGDGSIVRDYIYVEDLVDLCVKINQNFKTGIYNVSSMKGYNILELIDIIKSITNKKIIINFAEGRSFDVQSVVLDNESARKSFDWTPATTIEEGIRLHWNWINEYLQKMEDKTMGNERRISH